MVGSIRLFCSVRMSYKAMGIYSPDSKQIFTWNSRKLFFLFSLILMSISRIGYFVFDAKFAEDNGFTSFYQTFSALTALIVFSLCLWQMPVILQSMRMYDEFIKKRKFKPIELM